MRSSVADFEVIDALSPTPSGHPRYRCRPPSRLRQEGPVDVAEIAVDASGWHQLADQVGRICDLDTDLMLDLIEMGPDLDPGGSGVYLVAEAATGGTLAQPASVLGWGAIVSSVTAAADAVHVMHESGLTHGSIDGQAIVFTARGPVLAPPSPDGPEGLITRFSGWKELTAVDPDLLCGEPASRSSDIWSLGATLHAALSSAPLYRGIEDDEAVTAIQRLLFSPPVVDRSLPPDLVSIVSACLQPDRSKRPETAAEVASRLRALGGRA